MADSFGIKLALDGEEEFRKSINDINNSFKVLASEMKVATSQFAENDKSVQALTANNDALTKQIDLQKNKVTEYQRILNELAGKYGESSDRVKAWSIQANNAQAALNKLELELKTNAAAMNEINKSMETSAEDKFIKSIEGINKSFMVLDSEMKLVNSQFDKNDKSVQALTAKNDVLNKQIDSQKNKVSEYQKGLSELIKKYGESDDRVKDWTIQLNNAQAALNKLELELKNNKSEIAGFSMSADAAGNETQNLGKELDAASKKTSLFGSVLKASLAADAIKFGLNAITDAVKSVGSAVKSYISDASDAAASFAQSQTLLTQVMENTMDASESEVQSIIKLTEAQEKLGVVSRTAQVTALAELASFVERKDALEDMLPAMNDYIAYQYGVNASSEQARNVATALGKAIQGNIDGLAKQGFALTDNQKEWFKTADETQRVAFVMNMVSESMGGVNEALAQTDAGKMSQLNTVLENTKISVGELANEMKAQIAGQMLPSIASLSEAFVNVLRGDGTKEELKAAVGETIDSIGEVINEYGPILLEIGGEIVGELVDGIIEAAPDMIRGANKMIGELLDELNSPSTNESMKNSGMEAAYAFGEGFVENSPKVFELIKNSIIGFSFGLADAIMDAIDGSAKAQREYGVKLAESGAENLLNEFQKLTKDIKDRGLEVSDDMLKTTESLIKRWILSLDQMTENNINKIKTNMQKLRDMLKMDDYLKSIENLGPRHIQAWEEAFEPDKPIESAEKFFNSLRKNIENQIALNVITVEDGVAELEAALSRFEPDSAEYYAAMAAIEKIIENGIKNAERAVKTEFTNLRKTIDAQIKLGLISIETGIAMWNEAMGKFDALDVQLEIKKLNDQAEREAERVAKARASSARQSAKTAADAEKTAADEAAKARQEMLRNAEKEMADLDFFGLITLAEQLDRYKGLLKQFAEGTEEHLTVRKRILTLKNKIEAEALKETQRILSEEKDAISDNVFYNEISIDEQIELWKNLRDSQITVWKEAGIAYEDYAKDLETINKTITTLQRQSNEEKKKTDKESTSEFIRELDYQLKFTQLNEKDKLIYKLNAIREEIKERKKKGLEYKALEEQEAEYVKDLALEVYNEKIKLRQEEYAGDIEVLKKKTALKERNYADEIKYIAELQEKYKNDAAFRKKLAEDVYKYKEALIQQLGTLEEQKLQRTQQLFEQLLPSASKYDLAAEYGKIDEKAETSLKTSKSLTDAQSEYNWQLHQSANISEKITGLNEQWAEADRERREALEELRALEAMDRYRVNNTLEIEAAERRYNEAIAKQEKIERELTDASKEEGAASKETAKSKQELVKVSDSLIEQYPELREYIDAETGALNLSAEALWEVIEGYRELEKEKAKTKPQEDLLKSTREGVNALREYNAGMEKIRGMGLNENYVKYLEKQGVGGLDTIKAIMGFTPEDLREFAGLIEEAWNDANIKAAAEFAPDIEKVSGALEDVTEIITEFADSEELKESAAAVGNSIADTITETFGEKKPEIEESISGDMAEVLGSIATEIEEASKPIGNGIVQGIRAGFNEKFPELAETIRNAMATLAPTAMGELQISSPSKIFKNLVGKNIVFGIRAGIDDEMPNVIENMRGYSNMLAKSFNFIGAANQPMMYNARSGGLGGLGGSNNSALLSELVSIVKRQNSIMQSNQAGTQRDIIGRFEFGRSERDIFEAMGAKIRYYEKLSGVEVRI